MGTFRASRSYDLGDASGVSSRLNLESYSSEKLSEYPELLFIDLTIAPF